MKKAGWVIVIAGILVNLGWSDSVTLSKAELKNKIKGGWAGQTIGCTFGGPTEFHYRGTMIQDYVPIKWFDGYIKETYQNNPGLYDDVYMDLTFVDVFEKEGLDAPASSFAKAFAHAPYPLWHANQAARYNILRGLMPPESGHWLNNPHADDIDYQIEADFSGLMTPGMPNASAAISDKIGHIMNFGDGWYGGVYIGAMYSLAFVSDDMEYVVEEALKTIPAESQFYHVMQTVIQAHKESPTDWKQAWARVQIHWSEDIGCPDGVFAPFNIDATANCAWVILGLLFGDNDFGKTLEISTRCGDDSDCNPASAGGILATMIGYDTIPAHWKQGLAEVEPIDFNYTDISLNEVYEYSFQHAVEMIRRNGGSEEGDILTIPLQSPKAVRLEKGFEGHFPVEKIRLNKAFDKELEFEFDGIGFATTESTARKKGKDDYILEVEMSIDDKPVETTKLPTQSQIRKDISFWRYQIPSGHHKVELVVKNPSEKAEIYLGQVVIYNDKPVKSK